MPVDAARIAEQTEGLFLITAEKNDKQALRIVDSKGFVKIQHGQAQFIVCTPATVIEEIKKLWVDCCVYRSDMAFRPDIYVCYGARILYYSGIPELEQISKILGTELLTMKKDVKLIAVGAFNETM